MWGLGLSGRRGMKEGAGNERAGPPMEEVRPRIGSGRRKALKGDGGTAGAGPCIRDRGSGSFPAAAARRRENLVR